MADHQEDVNMKLDVVETEEDLNEENSMYLIAVPVIDPETILSNNEDVNCSTEVLPADEFFKNLFPDGYETRIIWQRVNEVGGIGGSCQARIALSTKEEFVLWLAEHQAKSGVIYRVRRTRSRDGKYCLYKADYRCQHNTLAHLNKSKQPAKKHTLCPAYLSVTIKAFPKKSRSKDPYLPRYPAIIKIHYVHNHPVYAAASLPAHAGIQTDTDRPSGAGRRRQGKKKQMVKSVATATSDADMDEDSMSVLDGPEEASDADESFVEDQAYHLKVLEYMFGDIVERVRQSYDRDPAAYDRAIEMACDSYQELKTDSSLLHALHLFGRFPESDSAAHSSSEKRKTAGSKTKPAANAGPPTPAGSKKKLADSAVPPPLPPPLEVLQSLDEPLEHCYYKN